MNRWARRLMPAVLLICTLALADGARAQDADDEDQEPLPEDLELTMTLMPEGEALPEAVTRTIELPPSASDAAATNAAGLSQANEARDAREEGLDTAAEARDKGRELGEQMAEQARENREDTGRSKPPPPPDGPPKDIPVPPGD